MAAESCAKACATAQDEAGRLRLEVAQLRADLVTSCPFPESPDGGAVLWGGSESKASLFSSSYAGGGRAYDDGQRPLRALGQRSRWRMHGARSDSTRSPSPGRVMHSRTNAEVSNGLDSGDDTASASPSTFTMGSSVHYIAGPFAAPRAAPPMGSVAIPEYKVNAEGVVVYHITVSGEALSSSPWRRFREFHTFRKELRVWTQATFPTRGIKLCSRGRMEERRRQLESWLAEVVGMARLGILPDRRKSTLATFIGCVSITATTER
eukprot:NODE_4906_length_1832_cov_10.555425.p1 GENE.NODE_4906_length_1832_cov_10.555425~~NODE_4906_length_1832_cov_10.555425.p1  ORF type:complete len:265 (+),score=58.83 NODE_4906_length_1832_cov_10.555425:316-1110(+)